MRLFDKILGDPDKKKRTEVIKTQKRFWNNSDFQKLVDYSLDEIKELPKDPIDDGDDQISEIYSWTAYGLWELTKSKDKVLQLALKAFQFNRVNKEVLWIIREVYNEYSSNTKTFKILANGLYGQPLSGDSKRLPFYTSYIVAAETPEEGLRIIKRLESADIAEDLIIDAYEELDQKTDAPKGIYETGGLIFYDNEENKKTCHNKG